MGRCTWRRRRERQPCGFMGRLTRVSLVPGATPSCIGLSRRSNPVLAVQFFHVDALTGRQRSCQIIPVFVLSLWKKYWRRLEDCWSSRRCSKQKKPDLEYQYGYGWI